MLDDPLSAQVLRTYALEDAPVVALQLDSTLRVTGANPQARRLLGEQALGRPFVENLVDFIDQTLDLRDGSARQRLTLSTLAGVPETLYFRFFPLLGGTLALGSLDFQEQLVLRDQLLGLNQELNDLTRQLHLANAELRELNELKNRFVGMAAHDLRRPLGIIMIYNQFLLDEAGDRLDPQQRGFLGTSLAAASGMASLVENFLEASVIESGQLRLQLAPTTLADLVGLVWPLASFQADRKKVELCRDLGDDQVTVRLDPARIGQVLINLLGNAVEHSTAGQRVWLVAAPDQEEMVFSVRDEGPGIAPEDQARLFAAFGQASTRKTAGERSVGLGLAIARLVVQAHGGRIWVESQRDRGSTFFVALPRNAGGP